MEEEIKVGDLVMTSRHLFGRIVEKTKSEDFESDSDTLKVRIGSHNHFIHRPQLFKVANLIQFKVKYVDSEGKDKSAIVNVPRHRNIIIGESGLPLKSYCEDYLRKLYNKSFTIFEISIP